MVGGRGRVLAVLVSTLLAAIPVALARRQGAGPGFTGGPSGIGQNCTACHPFNLGTGFVEILEAPRRYRANAVYDFSVRTTDPTMDGAGFEVSAEGSGEHQGTLFVANEVTTQYAATNLTFYVTHTDGGVDDSIAQWVASGGRYGYPVRWQAPADNAGVITFFAAANAVDLEGDYGDVKYYASQEISRFAIPGDADGDDDLDLRDFTLFQQCFNSAEPVAAETCLFVDMNHDGFVSLADAAMFAPQLIGPAATDPADYVLADPLRGGLLYDRWWDATRGPAPTGNHPLYPPVGEQSGSMTFRCKECHGWDYKGRDGAYGQGSNFTGIEGVFGTTLRAREMFDLLTADPNETPNGHNMDAYGMTDRDLWDVVKMVHDEVVNPSDFISPTGQFLGDSDIGFLWFDNNCASCHGFKGTDINFGTTQNPIYVGTIANENPWEFLHKVRFGHPGSPMISAERILWTDEQLRDVGAYAATLPQ